MTVRWKMAICESRWYDFIINSMICRDVPRSLGGPRRSNTSLSHSDNTENIRAHLTRHMTFRGFLFVLYGQMIHISKALDLCFRMIISIIFFFKK